MNYLLLFVLSEDGRYGTSKWKQRNPTQMIVRFDPETGTVKETSYSLILHKLSNRAMVQSTFLLKLML